MTSETDECTCISGANLGHVFPEQRLTIYFVPLRYRVRNPADRLAAGGDSILAQLSAQQFERGLAALRVYAKRAEPEPVSELVDYFVFTTRD